MRPEHMVVVDLDGRVVEGAHKPSVDTPTHLVLYKAWPADRRRCPHPFALRHVLGAGVPAHPMLGHDACGFRPWRGAGDRVPHARRKSPTATRPTSAIASCAGSAESTRCIARRVLSANHAPVYLGQGRRGRRPERDHPRRDGQDGTAHAHPQRPSSRPSASSCSTSISTASTAKTRTTASDAKGFRQRSGRPAVVGGVPFLQQAAVFFKKVTPPTTAGGVPTRVQFFFNCTSTTNSPLVPVFLTAIRCCSLPSASGSVSMRMAQSEAAVSVTVPRSPLMVTVWPFCSHGNWVCQ